MPSRPIDPPSPLSLTAAPTLNYHHPPKHLLLILTTTLTLTLFVSFLLLAILLYRKLSRSRTAPAETPNRNSNNKNSVPRRFSYSLLRRSTASFSPSTRLGHGGFGSVYKATLPSGVSLAVKLMDSPGSLQGEREFHNELSICASLNHPNILTLLGHSSDKRRRRLLLVYELMPNRSLQDAFFAQKSPELMDWRKRFDIVKHVASGLHYLHYFCDPPVIHGDIKPSNILLDVEFSAKIGDFGLARLKTEGGVLEEEECNGEGVKMKEAVKTNGSVLDDTESVLTTGFDENGVVDLSPESCVVKILDPEASPEMAVGPAGAVGTDKTSVFSEGCLDKASVDSGKDLIGRKNGGSGRDWWWKQENDEISGSESGRVKKDYVMEWIGNEIGKESSKSDWVASPSTSAKPEEKKRKKRLDWWASLDEDKIRKEKNKKPKEWWKEEFCEELSKKKKKTDLNSTSGREIWWQKDEDESKSKSKRKRKSKSSTRGSIDWWVDGLSGDLRNGIRRNSRDWTNTGDIPKSGGISSTPSMRGTICYIAPECGGGGNPSEKCDVYSFGVLLLVLVSGRRPLQVMASPMSEFERANLVSWAKQLARRGKLLDLVDPCLHSLDRDQALLCITVALLCLQRSPSKRPTMNEIVAVFSGEAEPPHLPFEFSPSPPSSFPFKSRRKTTAVL